MNQMKFDILDDDDYQQMLQWEEKEQKYRKNKHPLYQKKQNILNQDEDQLIQFQNISNNQMLQAQHQRPGTQQKITQYLVSKQQNPLKNNFMDLQQQQPQNFQKISPPPPQLLLFNEQYKILPSPQKIPPPPIQPKKITIQEQIIRPPLFPEDEPVIKVLQQKSQTLEICSNCNKSKEKNHQCDGEYGFVLCPYCGDSIVRNFMKDHQEDCIPYIESQFKNQEKVEECQICFEDITQNSQTLKCKHTFHKKCIDQWRIKSKECPTCRSI